MKAIQVNMGFGTNFQMKITESEFYRGEFFVPLRKIFSTVNMINETEPSMGTITKKMVFRKDEGDLFIFIGYED